MKLLAGILIGASPFILILGSSHGFTIAISVCACLLLLTLTLPMSTTATVLYFTTPSVSDVLNQYAAPLIAVGIAAGIGVGVLAWLWFEVRSRLLSQKARENAKPANREAI